MAHTTKRTTTMNWDNLAGNSDDDPDEFFESNCRISSVVPLDFRPSSAATIDFRPGLIPVDLVLSDDDDDDDDENQFEDSRISFTVHPLRKPSSLSTTAAAPVAGPLHPLPSMETYGIWMGAPGSIKERRKRLLQGMGINSNKDLSRIVTMRLSKKFSQKQTPPPGPIPPPSSAAATATTAPPPKPDSQKEDSVPEAPPSSETDSHTASEEHGGTSDGSRTTAVASSYTVSPTTTSQASLTQEVVLFRSRSDGELGSESFHTKRRREEMVGPNISKQRLTRSSSTHAPIARMCRFRVNSIHRTVVVGGGSSPAPAHHHHTADDPPLEAFFLIKNLDTGKEFIVKEFDQDGMWNRLSDIQTGKQLTMDEFEKTVAGYSPVVKELMRRQHVGRPHGSLERKMSAAIAKSFRYSKKRGASLLKNLKSSVSSGSNAEKEMAATEQQKGPNSSSKEGTNSPEWVKVKQQGKPYKEFTALRLCQEIQAHEGSIWTMKFNVPGTFLASAGEDKVIHVWEVKQCETSTLMLQEDVESPPSVDPKKKPASKNGGAIPDYVQLTDKVFGLSDKPFCSFTGHLDDVLDISWSTSNLQLLSSSMDKTVRLWDLKSKSCLKLFAHNDYVTCIQFNPVNDDYFISGSLDAKIRIWNVTGRRVVDWVDLHEMITAVCYSPGGQTAIIGTHKGSCRMYSTSDGKLSQLSQFTLPNKTKKVVKITGFEFTPETPSEALVTSADSRIRIYEGQDIIQKFFGFQNLSSQIAASYSPCGKHVICASEDSHVFVWRREEPRPPAAAASAAPATAAKAKTVVHTRTYEQFQCKDVSVAIPWPGSLKFEPPAVSLHPKKAKPPAPTANSASASAPNADATSKKPPLPKKPKSKSNTTKEKEEKITDDTEEKEKAEKEGQPSSPDSDGGKTETGESLKSGSMKQGDSAPSTAASPGWTPGWSWLDGGGGQGDTVQASAWGMVIVTAGLGGEIKAYQNFGLPVRVGKQKNLYS